MNYIALTRLNVSSECVGGWGEGRSRHLTNGTAFCVSNPQVDRELSTPYGKTWKTFQWARVLALYFLYFLSFVIQNNFWRTKPKWILKFDSLFTDSKNTLALWHCLTRNHSISEMFDSSEEYTASMDVLKIVQIFYLSCLNKYFTQ